MEFTQMTDRPAGAKDIAEFEAIKAVVEAHASALANPQTTLERALGDIETARALFEIDPEGLSKAVLKAAKDDDRDNLIDTVHSLCDIGETDSVARALKNVTLGAIQKSTGVTPQPLGGGAKISTSLNKSPVRYNGMAVKRSPTKSFNNVVNSADKEFNRLVSDSVNINASAKSILKEAMARKAAEADGRVVNPTRAASTINIPTNRQTNQGKSAVTRFTDDEDTLEGTWSSHMKKDAVEARGRMKSDTVAGKTVEIPVVRMASFEDTRARLPFEFRGVNPSDAAKRLTQGVVDVVNPNGSAHGPINFNTDGTQPNTYRNEGKKTLPQYRGGKANNGEPQQFPRKPTGDGGSNIESGRGYY
jgi:hypothetical protein